MLNVCVCVCLQQYKGLSSSALDLIICDRTRDYYNSVFDASQTCTVRVPLYTHHLCVAYYDREKYVYIPH